MKKYQTKTKKRLLQPTTYSLVPKGFTLIEMLVSVAIFSVVMVIALGALLAMSESDRKAQTLKSVINNLNFSLDAMARSMRTGVNYHCDVGQGTVTATRDCAATAATSIAFLSSDNQTVRYCRGNGSTCSTSGTAVLVSKGSAALAPITASEVTITNLQFYVSGAEDAALQPHVVILLSGNVPVSSSQTSSFDLQTSVTQRLYDQ
ncbi:MAG TPA: type II secretion system protein [Candidatus Paceibacterota bacterium]